jgi:glutaredoxin
MRVTVYTLPNCFQCDRTKKLMNQNTLPPDLISPISVAGDREAPAV